MPEKGKSSEWTEYITSITTLLADTEKEYDCRTEREKLDGSRDNHVRATRYSADAIEYIKQLCGAFIQDFTRDAIEVAKANKKKTVNYTEHILPIIDPQCNREPSKKAEVEKKLAQAARKWEFLGSALRPEAPVEEESLPAEVESCE
uniref:Transcription factor CBF/NF-Y/archaeal histone domain-containing protein n=1 Tax=Paramoeba aestuarina TaxID=180227 RepID=A0A7S4KSX7_9EUKA|mmetsp:Transcript_24788/g.38621  ORF Transcript_24788/g.38621 Transcript_24788/m.38621 type:complete len:147 (+) Transcript_24788:49-489(+)